MTRTSFSQQQKATTTKTTYDVTGRVLWEWTRIAGKQKQ